MRANSCRTYVNLSSIFKFTGCLTLLLIVQSYGTTQSVLDVQGHRGCRGVLPENTIEGFIEALAVGVTTLEMDVVISKDKQVVVSHEAYFSHEISTSPDGEPIAKDEEKQHNIYQMTYDEVKQYDVGLREHSRFPLQRKIPAIKPLLSDVLNQAEVYAENNDLKKPYYNIEIKRRPENDSVYNPPVEEFVRLVIQQVNEFDIRDRVIIQSFDLETLQQVEHIAPELKRALLIENKKSFAKNLDDLGYIPEVYSPNFKLVSPGLIRACHEKGVLIIPLTVNKKKDMRIMIELGVDGIITDFPEELIRLTREMHVGVK